MKPSAHFTLDAPSIPIQVPCPACGEATCSHWVGWHSHVDQLSKVVPLEPSVSIPLSGINGASLAAQVDAQDADLGQWKWYLHNQGYAFSRMDGRGRLDPWYYMHRVISERVHGSIPETIDHQNRNRLDNRRSNLRLATRSQQQANRRGRGKSGLRGVVWMAERRRWRAEVMVSGQRIYCGSYSDINDAIEARAKAAALVHGRFAIQDAGGDRPSLDVAR